MLIFTTDFLCYIIFEYITTHEAPHAKETLEKMFTQENLYDEVSYKQNHVVVMKKKCHFFYSKHT